MRERIEVLIQTGSRDWLRFDNPIRIVEAGRPKDVSPALTEVERLTREYAYHAVGFVTYEAGSAFGLAVNPDWEPARIRVPPPGPAGDGSPLADRTWDGLPLVWFACFDRQSVRPVEPPAAAGHYEIGALLPSLNPDAFGIAFREIKSHIARGDTYQVNYTFRMEAAFSGDPFSLFADLVGAQESRWGAFLTLGRWTICSASPELFFACNGAQVTARPMKGTAPRGRTPAEDRQLRDELQSSPKERAENVMIVDMVRNDLGRIAEIGSVEVPELFTLERYPNVWQMTSQVTARSMAPLSDLFAALHPPASVTGAPKVRTMEILSQLERVPRGVYTGAIGHIPPDGNACFNVAIRTAVVDHEAGTIAFGVGSGIVWDSDVSAEYDECLLKASVLGRRPPAFELLETLRWTPREGFFLLDRHLDRLSASAEYFGFPCDRQRVCASLNDSVAGSARALRIRLLVSRGGDVRVEQSAFEASRVPVRLKLAVDPVDPRDTMLFHKTTERSVYERRRRPDCDDVVLWNPHGDVTETTMANVVVEIDGVRLTPPVDSGLLAGTYRAEMLARGEIREATISVADLTLASRVWLINSVHEWREGTIEMEQT